MKYLQLLLITVLISACSGAKRVAESTPQKTTEPSEVKVKDVIIEKGVIANEEIDSTEHFKETLTESIQQDILQSKPLYASVWNSLLQTYVSENGHVNYIGFKDNWSKLRGYIESLSKNMPDENYSKNEKLAYWINAYNAMTIDLILRNHPVKSIKDIKNPWEQRHWKLGNKWYNLNDIEHRILRKMDEPRIHFSIVCASYSCPKLLNEAYTAENLEQQLTNATKDFLSDTNRNLISKDKLELSKIFQWFTKDFEQHGSLIDFLNKYSDIRISADVKTKYKDYNWDLNE